MAKGQNVVHQYFKKQLADGLRILVKVNPIEFTGTEITLGLSGDMQVRNLTFDEQIFDDLKADGFENCNPLEFNLYLSGLA
ncbi:MAG: hypothetical protein KF725_04115 [Cyclobacteriaceae bacterium]|nr:hypothetical protein [Cyclobacteriaceae bacterium]UYN85671.1 MAG: hypothetical protein KIT51_12395 [Cyclobacteriaceae bacterium]